MYLPSAQKQIYVLCVVCAFADRLMLRATQPKQNPSQSHLQVFQIDHRRR